MTAQLDGPRLAPASGVTGSLVIFLHGYGADGNDLIEIGRRWAPVLPDTAFVSPHAPDPCGEAPVGRQWFPLAAIDPVGVRKGAVAAAPSLDHFIDSELQRHSLSEAALVLVGFSQGTMMALHVGPRRPQAVAGIVGYSGLVPDPEYIAAEVRNRPPILLVHGDNDPLIPSIALHTSAKVLGEAGFNVEWHMRPGLEHGIDEEGLRLGGEFTARVLNQNGRGGS